MGANKDEHETAGSERILKTLTEGNQVLRCPRCDCIRSMTTVGLNRYRCNLCHAEVCRSIFPLPESSM